MTMIQKENLEKILREFNDRELGGGYLYFIHKDELLQLDLCDYSTCVVCNVEDILNVEFITEDEGIYLGLKQINEYVDHAWIYENGVEM
ncbi:aspartate kinase [Clostridium tetani]|uniref:hypothetical protein n=1 Tax=Clostridium tetani TaxID=1513 RepID=UPI0003244092|nr:hypothetical protein [Clostridium tetani]KGI37935.1 aspartate kinase [Clostridium tetani]KGI45342.1 aspartate kinase [Clostridium tetani]KHO31962.1 aspartate kinase [Clostridium tetani]KIG22145.1 aspartate kinase [Clostridium tetani]RXI62091.1 aspartate kinase [Clostridium tetani]